MSIASTSLLVARCILDPKHVNNATTALISYASVVKRRKSRDEEMLNRPKRCKIVPNENATSARESASKTSGTASLEAVDTESLTSQDLLE